MGAKTLSVKITGKKNRVVETKSIIGTIIDDLDAFQEARENINRTKYAMQTAQNAEEKAAAIIMHQRACDVMNRLRTKKEKE